MSGMNIDLHGRLALVTGGSGQLGRVMCRTLARCGADVAVHYHRNREGAEGLVTELCATGVRAHAVQADVTLPADVRAMRDAVNAQLGDPNIIVNNAVIQFAWTSSCSSPRTISRGSSGRACCTTS